MTYTGITGTDVVLAAQTLGATVRTTPLEESPRLTAKFGQPVLLKREDIQVGRSYKVRGAYNFMSNGSSEVANGGLRVGRKSRRAAYACEEADSRERFSFPRPPCARSAPASPPSAG